MTLPAHRYREREQRKKDDKTRVAVFDFDATITAAPKRMSRIAQGLKALGDHIVVLTGNQSPRADLERTLKDYDFPFDDLVQYQDEDSNGIARAEHLKQFGAWVAFDNRIDRAVIFAKVCPHLYLVAEPTKDDEQDAADGNAKKAAKKAAKKIGLREQRSEAPPPPNLRVSDSSEGERPERECGTCHMYDSRLGVCWGYGNIPVSGEWVCDEWSLDADWQEQDAAQDAADREHL